MYLSSTSEVTQSEFSVKPFLNSLIFKTGSLSTSLFGGYFWQAKPFAEKSLSYVFQGFILLV